MERKDLKTGDIVKITTDNSKGIVIKNCGDYVQVLFEDYNVMPIKLRFIETTDKYFDLSILWQMVGEAK